MPSPADIQTNIDAALAAMDAGDYATARIKILKAETIIASTPNMTREATAIQWRDSLAAIRMELAKLQSAASGIVTQQQVVAPSPNYQFGDYGSGSY